MNEASKNRFVDEINEILRSRFRFIEENYPQIRDIYKNGYDWPELDPLRHEICLCIFFGLTQVAITLTNHFFETLFKVALISHGFLSNQQSAKPDTPSVASFTQAVDPAFQKYNPKDLSDNINRACTVGLVTKEQKKVLQKHRDDFRNAFGHADKQKTFGDSTIKAQAITVSTSGFEIGGVEETELARLILAHGPFQAMQANVEAIRYFLYMDGIARQIRNELFGAQNNNCGDTSDISG